MLSWPAWLATVRRRAGAARRVRTVTAPPRASAASRCGCLADAVPGDQVDAVVAARAEEPPRGLGRDRGHAAALVVQEGGAETQVDGADERERLDPPLGGDPHAVALAQAELLGGGRVNGDLAGDAGSRPWSRLERQRSVRRRCEHPPGGPGHGTAVAAGRGCRLVGQARRIGDGDAGMPGEASSSSSTAIRRRR